MSDDGCASDNVAGGGSKNSREHHNILERKRRDQIKDNFEILKDTIPLLRGDKPVSRAEILRKASEYIQFIKKKNDNHQQDIDNLNRQNAMLEYQIKQLERVKATGNYTLQHSNLDLDVSESDSTDESAGELQKSKRGLKKKKFRD